MAYCTAIKNNVLLCKDLQDILWNKKSKVSTSVYGMLPSRKNKEERTSHISVWINKYWKNHQKSIEVKQEELVLVGTGVGRRVLTISLFYSLSF